jgi:ornithine cyclodeaminase/alanine dehydrogenase-like protein (mu-crystallin family)
MIVRYESISHRMYKDGRLKDSNFASLSDVMLGRVSARQKPRDRIQFLSHGMGSLDIAVAEKIYHNAKEKGLGQTLSLWNRTDLKLG